jgi:hypothetical protein
VNLFTTIPNITQQAASIIEIFSSHCKALYILTKFVGALRKVIDTYPQLSVFQIIL